jgi:hypothetical protein
MKKHVICDSCGAKFVYHAISNEVAGEPAYFCGKCAKSVEVVGFEIGAKRAGKDLFEDHPNKKRAIGAR